jgi:hypothetical protein
MKSDRVPVLVSFLIHSFQCFPSFYFLFFLLRFPFPSLEKRGEVVISCLHALEAIRVLAIFFISHLQYYNWYAHYLTLKY